METFSALLAICARNSPVSGEFPAQRSVTRSFDVFFDLCLNKGLSKQSWGWWFETLPHPLWRHFNVYFCLLHLCHRQCFMFFHLAGRESRMHNESTNIYCMAMRFHQKKSDSFRMVSVETTALQKTAFMRLIWAISLKQSQKTRNLLFWLPGRWASGFSGDHQQDHQCLWFLSCYNVTHLFCPHCLYSVGNKITTTLWVRYRQWISIDSLSVCAAQGPLLRRGGGGGG